MHGSVNWLYCDDCRQLWWFKPEHSFKIADRLLSPRDWDAIDPHKTQPREEQWQCPRCNVPLGTRLATFSYLKALDFPMFQKSWFTAETFLREADSWVFIGYSLPAADYEFKYLLKRVQLSRPSRPDIRVVTVDNETRRNYVRFFGDMIDRPGKLFMGGLQSYVEPRMKRRGAGT